MRTKLTDASACAVRSKCETRTHSRDTKIWELVLKLLNLVVARDFHVARGRAIERVEGELLSSCGCSGAADGRRSGWGGVGDIIGPVEGDVWEGRSGGVEVKVVHFGLEVGGGEWAEEVTVRLGISECFPNHGFAFRPQRLLPSTVMVFNLPGTLVPFHLLFRPRLVLPAVKVKGATCSVVALCRS